MCQSHLNPIKSAVCIGLFLLSFKISALEFRPGVGVGVEYTDNARLTSENQVDDTIIVGYIGARLEELEGPVTGDITASLNHQRYTSDSYEDTRYFNLGATGRWEMIKERFDWYLRNYYFQRPINTTDPNTPDNIQDSNIFTFGANMVFPVSARQTFTLLPEYRNFYYEIAVTDNQQLSLVSSWDYQVSSVTTVGLNARIRSVDYDEPLITDVTFGSVFFAFSGSRARSEFITNLGTTYVNRANDQSTEEFAGNLDWLVNLTSRSRFRAYIATDLTDSSAGALNATVDPGQGDPNFIQITSDVIRNQVMTLGYLRQIGTLGSSLTGEYRNLNYSESPNDRRIWNVSLVLGYPVTALLRSGFYSRYYNVEYIDTDRIDDSYTIGGDLRYQLSRNLHCVLDLKYRNRESNLGLQNNYNEWSLYASLTYGFGQPLRPTRTGGF